MAGHRKDNDQSEGVSLDSLPKWLRDMIDLNNESAGRETGRIKRFNLPVSDKALNAEKEKDERRFSALMRLLQDPHYARIYHHAVAAVTAAEEATDKARRKLEQESEFAEKRRRELLDKAAQLPDGTKIFQSLSDGRIYSEHGEDVTHRKDSITGLHPNSPSWEEYQYAKKITEEIKKQRQEVETYQHEVLDPTKKRLGDTENPATLDELEKITTKIKEEMPAVVQIEHEKLKAGELKGSIPTKNATADELFGSYEPNAPKIQADFKTAHDEPYGSSATSLPTIIPKFT